MNARQLAEILGTNCNPGSICSEASAMLLSQAAEIEALREALQPENAVAWREAVEFAAHKLEGARIWNGMDWHYNPLHPIYYLPALKRLRDVLAGKIEPVAVQPKEKK